MSKRNSGAKAPHSFKGKVGNGTYSIAEACQILKISRTGLQYYRIGGTYKYTYKGNEYVTEKEPIMIYRKDWDYCPKGGGIKINECGLQKIQRIRNAKH